MQQCPLQLHCQGGQSQTTNPWGETILEQETDRAPLPLQSLNLGTAKLTFVLFCYVAQMSKLRAGCCGFVERDIVMDTEKVVCRYCVYVH